MIKNVIFDIGDVLVNFRWRSLMQELGISKKIQDRFADTVFASRWWHELDHGTMEEEEAAKRLKKDNEGYESAFEQVWDNRDKLVDAYPYAVPWIDSLRERGYRVYLLSNYPKDIFTLHASNGSFPFLDHVDGKIVSGFVKMIKPDADIYECLLHTYGLKAEESVFLDDRQENVEGARRVGIHGIRFENYEQACADLEKLLK